MNEINTTPSQIRFPGRAVARTAVATLITAVTILNLVVPVILDAVNTSFPGKDFIWLNTAAIAISGFTAVVTRIMAIPQINQYLAKLNLSATK